jgi:hypothetical protein
MCAPSHTACGQLDTSPGRRHYWSPSDPLASGEEEDSHMKKALALVIIGAGISLAGCTHYPMSHHDQVVKGALIGGVVGGVVGGVASGGTGAGIAIGAGIGAAAGAAIASSY